MTGRIARVKNDKGYGFIYCEDDGEDYFFMSSSLRNAVFSKSIENKRVNFDPVESNRGPRAANITVLE